VANFIGRLALHVADDDAGMECGVGHSSPSLTNLHPASLGFGSAVTGDFVASPVSFGEDPWESSA
jgi:hypothetical protein